MQKELLKFEFFHVIVFRLKQHRDVIESYHLPSASRFPSTVCLFLLKSELPEGKNVMKSKAMGERGKELKKNGEKGKGKERNQLH